MEGWCRLCFGRVQPTRPGQAAGGGERADNTGEDNNDNDNSSSASSASDPENYSVTPPLVSILAAMDQVIFAILYEVKKK